MTVEVTLEFKVKLVNTANGRVGKFSEEYKTISDIHVVELAENYSKLTRTFFDGLPPAAPTIVTPVTADNNTLVTEKETSDLSDRPTVVVKKKICDEDWLKHYFGPESMGIVADRLNTIPSRVHYHFTRLYTGTLYDIPKRNVTIKKSNNNRIDRPDLNTLIKLADSRYTARELSELMKVPLTCVYTWGNWFRQNNHGAKLYKTK